MPPTPAATATAVLYQVASGQAVGCGDSGSPPPPPAQSITLSALGGLSATAGGSALNFSAQVANPTGLPLTFALETVSGPTGTPTPSSSTWSLGDLNKAISVAWAAAGTSVIRVRVANNALSNSLSVTVAAAPTPGPPPPPPAPAPPSADWVTRSTGPSVVWSHNFESDTEVTAHLLAGQTMDSVRARRVVDSSGIGCLEQIALGATLAANYTAGSPTMVINDTTHWPDPAVTGPFEFQVCRAHPSVGNKNGFMCTARVGTTLTVTYIDYSGVSAYAPTPQSYVVGDYAGSEASDWRRTFAALPAGENGKAVDDPGASGAVPLRSKLSGNAYSVPRDTSLWQYGWYGHPNNQTIWADWTGWGNSGVTKVPLTPRGVSQGAAARFRLWDGDEFYVQWRQKVDPRFYANHAQPDPNGETSYWGRKAVAIQSELASVNQVVMGISTSNRYSLPDTTKAPVSLSTYKAARVIGVSDYPSRVSPSNQKNSPWDIAPHYANLSSSFKPSSGLSTPDGSTAWELPDNEWVTFYLRVKPGRSGVAETEIELKFARTEDPAYTGAYTTLMNVTDANIVYSGSGDYDFPDGVFDHPAVTVMNALPGFQAFGIMGYFNITQSVGIPPAKASYYVRLAQVIFSKAAIAPPASDVLPAWRQGQTPLTWAAIGSSVAENVDPENDPTINPNHPANAPWRNTSGGGDIFRAWNSWCTGVWSESTGKFRVPAQGGHDDYAGNEVYLQNLLADSPVWTLERKPTGAIGNTGTLHDGQENSMVYFDGRPRSTHGYDLFCDRLGDVWGSGNGPFQNGNNLATKFFKFSESTSDWSVMATNTFMVNGASANGAGSIVWDESRDTFYGFPSANIQLSKFVVATSVASQLPVYTDAGQQTKGIRIPELDIIVWLNPSYPQHIGVYDYGRTGGASLVKPGATGTPPSYGGYTGGVSMYPNGVWVPGYGGGVGVIICWHGGTSFKVATPNVSGNPSDPWAWGTLSASGSNVLNPGNPNSLGVYGRFFYSRRLKGLGLSLQPNLPTYFFALE